MTRSIIKGVLTAGFFLGVWSAADNKASAQFFPQPRPGIYWNNPLSGPGFLNFNYSSSFMWSGVNPVTGPYSYGFGFSWSGTPIPGAFPFGPYRPFGPLFPYPGYGYSPGYNYGGYGSTAGSGPNAITLAQLRAFRHAYNPPTGNDVESRKIVVEKWNKEMGGQGGAIRPPQPGHDDFANVPDAVVQSGKTINQLVALINDREKKGAKADAPLLPLDLLKHLHLAGGIPADALSALQAGEIQYPEVFLQSRFNAIRDGLDKPLVAVAGPLLAGKKVDVATGDRLVTAVKHAKTDMKPFLPEMNADEQKTANQFLDQIASLAEVAKNPTQYAGLLVPKWFAIGVNASEFSNILTKFKIQVSPSGPGDAEAYQVLHQGLAGYLTMLPAPKQ